MEFNEMMLKEEQEIIDEMFRKGELVDEITEELVEEIKIIKERKRFGNKLVLAAGLGLAGYVLYKTVIKPIIIPTIIKKRKTQSEVIVEEVK